MVDREGITTEPLDASRTVRITLTPDQARELKALTGRDAEAIELSVQELEQRIVPSDAASGVWVTRLALNCNETLLVRGD